MDKENCALKLVDEIIIYYEAQSKKHQNKWRETIFLRKFLCCGSVVVAFDKRAVFRRGAWCSVVVKALRY